MRWSIFFLNIGYLFLQLFLYFLAFGFLFWLKEIRVIENVKSIHDSLPHLMSIPFHWQFFFNSVDFYIFALNFILFDLLFRFFLSQKIFLVKKLRLGKELITCLYYSFLFFETLIDVFLLFYTSFQVTNLIFFDLFLMFMFIPFSFKATYLFDVNIDDIVKPLSQFSSQLNLPVDVFLKKVLIGTFWQFTQDKTGTLIHKVVVNHKLLNNILFELHQIVDLEMFELSSLQSTVALMLGKDTIIVKDIPLWSVVSNNIKTILTLGFANEVKKVCFSVSEHPEMRTGCNF